MRNQKATTGNTINMHKALRLLKQIPKGKVVTYKELARVCNTSPRAIGMIMARNKDPLHLPCYKVVSSTGELCGYRVEGGVKRKRQRLEEEGIVLSEKGIIDKSYFYMFKN